MYSIVFLLDSKTAPRGIKPVSDIFYLTRTWRPQGRKPVGNHFGRHGTLTLTLTLSFGRGMKGPGRGHFRTPQHWHGENCHNGLYHD